MSTELFNLNLLDEAQPSLCIPRAFNNITEQRIRKIFQDLSLGKVSCIDMKAHTNEKGEVFNRVYIHFEKWFWNEDAQIARRKLILGKEIKIIYDNPWFWKVSASKWTPSSNPKYLQEKVALKQRSSAYIVFDHEEETRRNTDEFGRDLCITDLNTDEFGRDLCVTDLNTDEFGRDLSIKKNYDERLKQQELERINNLINNFKPINRRPDNRRPDNRRPDNRRPDNRRPDNRRPDNRKRIIESEPEPEPSEPETTERKLLPFASNTEDLDRPTAEIINIDYGKPLPVPPKKRKIISKPLNQKNQKINILPTNWYDDDSDTDTDDEINTFLTETFNKISIDRPRSPDYPPPQKNQEEEEFDLYADL